MTVRKFYFERGTDPTAARDAIEAALDDEGLVLRLRQGERLVMVQQGVRMLGLREVVAIPEDRIVPKPTNNVVELAEARKLLGL